VSCRRRKSLKWIEIIQILRNGKSAVGFEGPMGHENWCVTEWRGTSSVSTVTRRT